MVFIAGYFGASIDWIFIRFYCRKCHSTIHLYAILMKKYSKILLPFLALFFVAYRFQNVYLYCFLGILFILVLLNKNLREKTELYWQKLGDFLGIYVPKVWLSILYFLLLLPISWFYRLKNKNLLNLKNNLNSLFDKRNKSFQKIDFERIW